MSPPEISSARISCADENEIPLLVPAPPKPTSSTEDFTAEAFTTDDAPSDHFTREHEVFIAYLKHHVPEEEIAERLLATFPDAVVVRGGNAHGKLMRKWGAIERYVAMMTSRWAPVQEPGLDVVGGYAWGEALVEEFEMRREW